MALVIGAHARPHAAAENKLGSSKTPAPTRDGFLKQLSSAIESGSPKSPNGTRIETAKRSSPLKPLEVKAKTPAVTTAGTTSGTPLDRSSMTPTDAYWADQPAAVQALRNASPDQRAAMAQQLASQGYTIDVPIMVWGWDPLATMIERQTAGYTWVPSALQPNIQEAPGACVPGLTAYDPKKAPAGSIQVSTAFADGTNIAADPIAEMWIKGQSST